MNARQKAKYWKKKYEQLANMPMPTTIIEPHAVSHLKFYMEYPNEWILKFDEEEIEKRLKKDIKDQLFEEIDKYIDYRCEKDVENYKYRFSGMLNVVRR